MEKRHVLRVGKDGEFFRGIEAFEKETGAQVTRVTWPKSRKADAGPSK